LVAPTRITGALVSITVKVIVHVLALEAASLAVKVIKCSPKPKPVPGSGSWLKVNAHTSVTLSSPVRSGNVSKQFVPAPRDRLVVHNTNTGGVSSTTVTSDVVLALNPF